MSNPKDDRCPNCGYCKHCGRSNPLPQPYYYPMYPPTYPPYPWWSITTTTTTGEPTP